MNVGFGHAGVVVSDMARSLDFYVGALGFSECARWYGSNGDMEIVMLQSTSPDAKHSQARVELLEYRDRELGVPPDRTLGAHLKSSGRAHFALVVENVDLLASRLSASGWQIPMPPTDVVMHGRICFVLGPDQELIELLDYKSHLELLDSQWI